jgi:hypothetical protein
MDKELTITADSDHMNKQISALDTSQIASLTIENIADLNLDTISIDTASLTASSYAIGSSGGGGFLTSNGSSAVWNSNQFNWPQITNIGSANSSGALQVKGDAEFDGDVKIQGHSILHLLKKIEDRLAVLQEPDPERLEKFAALKKAYEHYKTLERLIGED